MREVLSNRNPLRTYCNKKEDIIEKLDSLEQKIQGVVRDKTIACLETKCKQEDASLPDCTPSTATAAQGRKVPVEPVPQICPKPTAGPDTCIRPYVNPCPTYPVRPCMPEYRTVDPCREPCRRLPTKLDEQKVIELSVGAMKVLLALTTLVAIIIIYKALNNSSQEIPLKRKKRSFKKPKFPTRVPGFSSELPSKVPYIIVGGGPAAYSAMKTLISLDENAKVLMINKEPYYPYDRNPLNTDLVTGNPAISKTLHYIPKDSNKYEDKSIYFENEEFYSPPRLLNELDQPGAVVSVARGWSVVKVDSDKKFVVLEDGKKIAYEKCILATGSSPKNLRVFSENSDDVKRRVSHYFSVYDYLVLEEIIESRGTDLTIAIVGSGLNATVLACSLRRRGIKVIQLYKESGSMHKILPAYLSAWLTKKLVQLGVTVINHSEILDALIWKEKDHEGQIAMFVNNKEEKKNYLVFADHILVSVGNQPNTELAEESGIEVDKKRGGFVVNRELQIETDLYAAGDCISLFNKRYGRRHIEHYEHAIETGKAAVENLLGERGKPFDLQTRLWSDILPTLGYEALGVIDSSLPTVGVYMKEEDNGVEKVEDDPQEAENHSPLEDFNKGLVFYLRDEKIVGILAWNVFDRIPLIRQILEHNKNYNDVDELAKLMRIHK